MALQYVNIKDSKVNFINPEKDSAKKTEMLESDLANMTFESMMDKFKITQLEDMTAQLTFEVMQLKIGGDLT